MPFRSFWATLYSDSVNFHVRILFLFRNKFMKEVSEVEGMPLRLAEAALTFDPPHAKGLFCECGKLPRYDDDINSFHITISDLVLCVCKVQIVISY